MDKTGETRRKAESLVETVPDEAVPPALAQVNGASAQAEPLVESAPEEAVVRALAQAAGYPARVVESKSSS